MSQWRDHLVDDMAKIYKLNAPEVCLSRKFLKQFEDNKLKAKKREMVELIKNW
jgi:hypothetical protein